MSIPNLTNNSRGVTSFAWSFVPAHGFLCRWICLASYRRRVAPVQRIDTPFFSKFVSQRLTLHLFVSLRDRATRMSLKHHSAFKLISSRDFTLSMINTTRYTKKKMNQDRSKVIWNISLTTSTSEPIQESSHNKTSNPIYYCNTDLICILSTKFWRTCRDLQPKKILSAGIGICYIDFDKPLLCPLRGPTECPRRRGGPEIWSMGLPIRSLLRS